MSAGRQHVPDDLLAAFVEGDVGEQLAVHIAGHLDDCPACSARAAGLEPLHAAFAALPDPPVPADLVPAVLEAAARPEPMPWVEAGVSAALLLAAGAVAALLGDPVGLAADFGVVLSALSDGARVAALGLASSGPVLVTATAVALIGVILTARLASPDAIAGMTGPRRSP